VEPTPQRVVIGGVTPQVDGGRFRAKRVVGEPIRVEADVLTDGHDRVAAAVRYRHEGTTEWTDVPMVPIGNDRFAATFVADHLGPHEFTVVGWVDRFVTWRSDLVKRLAAETVTDVDLVIGADLLEDMAGDVDVDEAAELTAAATALRDPDRPLDERADDALDGDLAALVARVDPRRFATTLPRSLPLQVDRPRARFSSWYELFPRSAALEPGQHGTLRDVEGWLPYVADMGFDVLYLPPIHPIGVTARKGPNNAETAGPDDVGSPWAIGSAEGGHRAIHPELGTHEDFDHLVAACIEHGVELAMDIAFQCAPDHPYVTEHPEWFRHRPDGTIQYAENPPKRYQDIVPFDFECDAYETLWEELRDVVLFWVQRGVRIFRVDNPHTKSLHFWEWCIEQVQADHPDVIFLAEAFTRPKLMYGLARRGFTQSYTYFAWRHRRWEIEQYWNELTSPPAVDMFRPNAWPNTPDILTEFLQYGGRPAFVQRLVLAATLCASYGIYGPAFELQEHVAREPGSEEYLDSEKYQLRDWDVDREDSLRDLVALVNRVRHEHPALQQDRTLQFHHVDNEELVAYSKVSDDGEDRVLVIVNLDPHGTRVGTVHLDLGALGLEPDQQFQVHDLLSGARHLWHGSANYVELNPHVLPAHVLTVHAHSRTEQDFAYYV
jgi:starch synthase (maltosyl-transferring)